MRLTKAIESLYYDKIRDQVGLAGWAYDYSGNDYTLTLKINGKEWPFTEVRRHLNYLAEATTTEPGFEVTAKLGGVPLHTVELLISCEGETESFVKRSKLQMRNFILKEPIQYHLDVIDLQKTELHIQGWAVSLTRGLPQLSILDQDGNHIPFDINRIPRSDVYRMRGLDESQSVCGFRLKFVWPENGDVTFRIDDGVNHEDVKITHAGVEREEFLKKTGYRKTVTYLKQNGVRKTAKKIVHKVLRIDNIPYEKWYAKICLTDNELQYERLKKFDDMPKISFVVPLYRTPEIYLREMIDSVIAQTYSNWELCLADGSGEGFSLKSIVSSYGDDRIKYKDLGENLGIAGNTNAALQMATGDYIALVDHDDLLVPEAAFFVVQAINEHPGVEVIYSDEDKIDMKSKKHFDPNFKPDFNIDMLRSVNYICHLFVMKKNVLDEVGGFREEYNGAQDHDMILRATESRDESKIYHIARVLYHWRVHRNSTAQDPKSKLYAFESGIRAVNDHYKRMGIPAHVEHGVQYGMYRSIYEWNEQPKVSILIPNKDHTDDLNIALTSIFDKLTYKNVEVIVIENNSTEKKTWKYYEEIQKAHDNVKVVTYKATGGFNYSAINNFGEKYATGEYLLLLNNDVEFINENSLEEMLAYAMRPDVGAVGAKLLYNDGTIQHAGVVIGLGGVAGHAFPNFAGNDPGYMGRAIYAQNYLAVTAACLMVKKSKFEEVGGLEEKGLAVAFNDVDFCLKLWKAGYKTVYTPYATLFHYESKSRGMEDTPEKQERFAKEIDFFKEKWADLLFAGDPCYNPNLTLDKNDFSLRDIYNDVRLR